MKLYRVAVEQEDDWFCLSAVNDPRVYTQARSLDEAIFMVRDVVALLYGETGVQIELVVPPDVTTPFERRRNQRGTRTKSGRAKKSRLSKPTVRPPKVVA